MDRVELIIALMGDKDAIRSLQEIDKEAQKLNKTKIQIQIDRIQNKKEILELQRQMDELVHKRNKIQLDISELEAVKKDIKYITGALAEAQLRFRTAQRLNVNSDEIEKAAKRVVDLETRLEELKTRRREIQIDHTQVVDLDKQIEDLQARINELTNKDHEMRLNMQGAEEARKSVEELQAGAQKFVTYLQSAANILTNVGHTMQNIGGMFTNNNVIDTLERYATIMATNMFAGDWSKATQRFDIMNTYAKYLDLVGISAEEADASLNKINANIQGIPVGLDEVAQQTRMYNMYIGDMERATNLAIGLNRALIAGGASAQMRRATEYQLTRLLLTGELNTKRQWNAFMQGLGVSSNFLREEMGYGHLQNNEFIAGLSEGTIAVEELIRGLEKLASSNRLNAAIEIYRSTIESGLSNIQFALTRGKANILTAVNETLGGATGNNISGWLYEIRDGINEVYKAVAGWVRANPQVFTNALSAIVTILERIKNVNWGSIFNGIIKGTEQIVTLFAKLIDLAPDWLLEDFVVFSMTWATPIGKGLTLLGDALGGLADKFLLLAAISPGFASWLNGILPLAKALPALTAGFVAAGAIGKALGSISEYNFEQKYGSILQDVENIARVSSRISETYKQQNDDLDASLKNVGAQAEQVESLLREIYKNNSLVRRGEIDREEAIRRQTGLIERLKSLYPDFNAKLDLNTGLIDKNTEAIAKNAKAYAESIKQQAEADAYRSALEDKQGLLIEAETTYAEANKAYWEAHYAWAKAKREWDARNLDPTAVFSESNGAVDALEDSLEKAKAARAEAEKTRNDLRRDIEFISDRLGNYMVEAAEEGADAYVNLTQYLEETKEAFSELTETISKNIGEQISLFQELEKQATVSIAKVSQIAENNAKAIGNYADNLMTAIEFDLEHPEFGLGSYISQLSTGGPEMAGYLQGLIDAVGKFEKGVNGAEESIKRLGKAQDDLNYETAYAENMATLGALDPLSRIANAANGVSFGAKGDEIVRRQMEDYITELLGEGWDIDWNKVKPITTETGVELGRELVNPIANGIKEAGNQEIAKALLEVFKLREEQPDADLGEALINMFTESVTAAASGDAAGNVMKALGNALFNEDTVSALKEMATSSLGEEGMLGILGLGEEEVQSQLESLTTLQEGILTAAETMGLALNGEEESLGGAFSAVNDWITRLVDESAPLLMETVASVGEAVTAFYEGAVEGLRAKLEETEEHTKRLEEAIIKLANTMNSKTPTVDAFTSAMDRLRAMVGEAERAVIALREAINSLQDKEVTVTYVENHVGGFSGGGMVQYRAIGGSIFKPRGTDTVPAMLTPGEFVIRRDAVNKLGAPFLQMINRLDIPNAIDALMSRVNMPTMGGYVTYDNRRTYDNHATVNQNIYTNNPSYTYRRASRWANAL